MQSNQTRWICRDACCRRRWSVGRECSVRGIPVEERREVIVTGTSRDWRIGLGDGVRNANMEDLAGIVQVHTAAFPDYFLTHLGRGVVSRYYGAYLQDPGGVNVVATRAGVVCSFASGTSKQTEALDDFYKRNLLYVTWAVIRRLAAMDRVVINGLMPRLSQVGFALKASFRPKRMPNEMTAREVSRSRIASLVSIATCPEFQGTAMSSEVLAYFEEQLRACGTADVHLTVSASNARAGAFYAKSGWTVLRDGEEVTLQKHLA